MSTHLQRCAARAKLLDVLAFWRSITGPRRTSRIRFDHLAHEDWRAYSKSRRYVHWDQDPLGQLLLLSSESRQVTRTLPWPGGVEAESVRWVTSNERQVWLFGDAPWLFEAGRWTRFEWPYAAPSGWIADPQRDGVWASVPDLGLLYLSRDAMRLYHPRDRLFALPVERSFEPYRLMSPERGLAATTLAETTDGRIWAGTDGAGLWVYDEQEELWQPTDITQDFVDALLADSSGGLWIGTRFTGLVRYDGKSTWRRWRIPDGLPSDTITSLAHDRHGRLWVGTADDGLARFDGRTWQSFDTSMTVGDGHITKIVVDTDNAAFFGYYEGVGRYDGTEWDVLPYEGRAGSWPTAMVLDDAGQLWVANYVGYGLDVYTPAGVLGVCEGIVDTGSRSFSMRNVRALLFDTGSQSIWAASSVLFQIESESKEWRYVEDSQVGPILALLKDQRGRLWAAGYAGVSMYDSAQNSSGGARDEQ